MHVLIALTIAWLLAAGVEAYAAGATQKPDVTVPAVTDVTVSQHAVSNERQTAARLWGLSNDEYARYTELKVIDASFAAENVTPYEVLGKYARNPSEQLKYAKLFRDRMVENQARSLEWWAAVQEVTRNLTAQSYTTRAPNAEKQVNRLLQKGSDFVQGRAKAVQMSTLYRVTLFVAHDCEERCQSTFKKAMDAQKAGTVAGVDVVFVGMDSANTNVVTQWAIANHIPAETVNSRIVTLNHDNETFTRLRAGRGVPLLVTGNGSEVNL